MKSLGDLRKEPHWSVSQLNTFLSCSLQWAYRYYYKIDSESVGVALLFGKAIHTALSFSVGEDPEDAKKLFADEFHRLVKNETLPVLFPQAKDLESLTETGLKMMDAFLLNLNTDKITGIGIPFSVNLIDRDGQKLKKPLIGEFDAVENNEGMTIIVDWKTAGSKWPEGKADGELQATAYLMAYEQMHNEKAVARFDICTKAKTPRFDSQWTTRDDDDSFRLVELVKSADKAIESEAFYPSPTFMCAGCSYKQACKKWHCSKPQLQKAA
ncbi:MAG: PD-(D/E)XK nuclease family protein [Lentisphaeria bacterium]|nr:PD-(D/E)XK nuclease family protein [Lentisphaeria bacterium]NQZ71209.1 PD-(D/E)XK nuclease family protein [Lentisphaeria bacterium]